MEITREYLEGEMKNVQAQRDDAASIVIQADGALSALQAVLNKLDEAETPPEV